MATNPCRELGKDGRALMKPPDDPTRIAYVTRLEDMRRIYLKLYAQEAVVGVVYALGAFSGLRIEEACALDWRNVDLAARRITVRQSVTAGGKIGGTKSGKARVIPIFDTLLPVLREQHVNTGGRGLVAPSPEKGVTYLPRTRCRLALRQALNDLGFPKEAQAPGTDSTLNWYRASRHSFASHWVREGKSLKTLSRILGHASVTTTERHYLHQAPDDYTDRDLVGVPLDLTAGGAVVPMTTTDFGSVGHSMATLNLDASRQSTGSGAPAR